MRVELDSGVAGDGRRHVESDFSPAVFPLTETALAFSNTRSLAMIFRYANVDGSSRLWRVRSVICIKEMEARRWPT